MPPKRILVIDDELSFRDALQLVITELGHHVDLAKNGAVAKELLKGAPPAVAGGCVALRTVRHSTAAHPPATAGGTDRLQVRPADLESKSIGQ